jgi:hypothetical protein
MQFRFVNVVLKYMKFAPFSKKKKNYQQSVNYDSVLHFCDET